METHNRLLWAIAGGILRGVGSEQDIEECVADVYITHWRNPQAFDPERGSVKTYLALLARSRALDRYRALTRDIPAELDDEVPGTDQDVDDALIADELFGTLYRALDDTPEPDREILVRRYFFEERPREIAHHMNIAVKEVNNRLYAAKRRLRRELEEA
jgi:RNA polymerase sigma-70 factor (ECF subfamily)